MKIICAQNELASNLSLVSRAVPSRPTHPVLANVLLTADVETQQVQLTAFDLSVGIRTSFEAQVEEAGAITLPAKLLNDIVSKLPEGEIIIDDKGVATGQESSEKSASATLTSTSGQYYQVRGMDASDYPELPAITSGQSINLPAEALIEGLRGTLFAASSDETKQILTGVHVKILKDSLEFASTDGHRLAVVETELPEKTSQENAEEENETEEFEVTIPARALRELERMVAALKEPKSLTLNFDQSQIIFEIGQQSLTSRKLEGQYPNYRQLLPRQFANHVTVERKKLLSALERIAILADQKNHIVKCTFDNDAQEVYLSVDAADVGSGRESMSAQISSDEPREIAFNVRYLMDGLKVFNTSEIQILLNKANMPVVLTPLGELKMTYLVMPVQLR
ncbi:MAG: DNA polymerase III subunit beta [Oscillatoriaceae bacterium SKW80]|nr:DNA polymerase III subunit beta [Oscillatoriaceae bacterium SKYG93]MCX8121741.1 DNA polymerase III subunit beta [Oscillatoriaceae bacterium SKW80]MDW8453643.1 DNA polymerase III subunit beta [Oscillatoriaceae cyanobacterium SKYGB_i_bin93]HIK28708.1 DNA polymerase III subunit beta [Oscillatoriaceae cyanobacterium M7585_C2015_266]